VIITTTDFIEDHRIKSYCGMVHGTAIMGADFIAEMKANMTDTFGGRSSAYEREFAKAREYAIGEMQKEAEARGANAIVGVTIDYEVASKKGNMMMVAACGTAIFAEHSAAV
jgi:uncharacterized protein YbjQ (UPF0145 family)